MQCSSERVICYFAYDMVAYLALHTTVTIASVSNKQIYVYTQGNNNYY